MTERLPPPWGSRLDRTRKIRFAFDGQALEGFAGDCIASAMAGTGRWILSRSFKYHRPRGILTMAGQDANTLVQLPDEPNVRADLRPITAGLQVTAQNVSGTAERDRGAVLDRLGRFMPVGFYYRSFFRPGAKSWLKFWEPMTATTSRKTCTPTCWSWAQARPAFRPPSRPPRRERRCCWSI